MSIFALEIIKAGYVNSQMAVRFWQVSHAYGAYVLTS